MSGGTEGLRPDGGTSRPTRSRAAASLCAVLLAACPPGAAAAQEADPPARDTAPADTARRGADGGRAEADTLTLRRALEVALSENPDVAAARARLSGASAGRVGDWGALLPDVTGRASFDRTDGTRLTFRSEDGTPRAAPEPIDFISQSSTQTLSLDWTLLESGRGLLDLKEGAARVGAAEHRVSARERAVAGRVKRAYFEALKQQRLLEVAREQLEARREDLEVTRERVEAGAGTRTDLLGARVEVGNAELAVLDARDLAGQEVRTLLEEMGLGGGRPGGTPALRDPGAPPDAAELDRGRLVERALSSDPEIQALEADAAAASAASTRGWTRYLPEVTASYSLSRSEDGGAASPFFNLDPSDTFESLGVTVSWNLLDGLGRQEEIGRARAERAEARAERTRRRLEVERRVANLVSELRRRADRLEVLERNAELAAERLELARVSYEEGLRTFDELQDFIDEERSAEERLARERYEYLKRWADLEEVVGALPEAEPTAPTPSAGPR